MYFSGGDSVPRSQQEQMQGLFAADLREVVGLTAVLGSPPCAFLSQPCKILRFWCFYGFVQGAAVFCSYVW